MLRKNSIVLVAANILHYIYFLQKTQQNITVIGSRKGLLGMHESDLHINKVLLYDTENNLEPLINAHANTSKVVNSYITWKPIQTDHVILGNQYDEAHMLERKVILRGLLPKELFPKYVLLTPEEIATCQFSDLSHELESEKIVVQIDFSTGGKGTFVVSSANELNAIRDKLVDSKQSIVASKYVPGVSRGLQCYFDTKKILATKWWHKDLVGIEGVCNLANESATRYCGAVVENIPEAYQGQVKELYKTIEQMLLKVGYFGVFGIDIVVNEAEQKVYLIEINPRFTAVSHLYASAMHAVGFNEDFLTLHIDSLIGGRPKNLESDELFSIVLTRDYYYLKIQNISDNNRLLTNECKLGVYTKDGSYLRFGFGIQQLLKDSEIVVIPEVSATTICTPGDRMFSIIGIGGDVIRDGKLSSEIQAIVSLLSDKFTHELP